MAAILRELADPHPLPRFPESWFQEPARLVSRLRDRWERTCRNVAHSGRVEELHAVRDDYRRYFDGYEQLLKGCLILSALDQGAFDPALREPARFEAALAELARLKDEIFTPWVTADDLEQMLAEKLTLPAWAAAGPVPEHLRPPPSWYEETTDPFAAE